MSAESQINLRPASEDEIGKLNTTHPIRGGYLGTYIDDSSRPHIEDLHPEILDLAGKIMDSLKNGDRIAIEIPNAASIKDNATNTLLKMLNVYSFDENRPASYTSIEQRNGDVTLLIESTTLPSHPQAL